MINPNKQDYINAEIFKFVELLEFSTENSSYEISEGSIKLKNNIDLTDLLINTPTIICEKNGDNIISKKEFEVRFLGIDAPEINYCKKIKQDEKECPKLDTFKL